MQNEYITCGPCQNAEGLTYTLQNKGLFMVVDASSVIHADPFAVFPCVS